MSPRDIVILFTPLALWFAVCPVLAMALIRRRGLCRANFLGNEIPTAYGLTILLWTPAAAGFLRSSGWFNPRSLAAVTMAVLCFGVLGLIDDLFGDRSVGGLKGHFRKLFVEGRITTGFVKAVGGAVAGVVIARSAAESSWPTAIINGAIIALSANAINLLDLRPGRACAAFLVTVACLIGFNPASRETISPLWLVVIPALVVYAKDYRGLAMIGDTGSNLLGAALGVSVVSTIDSGAARLSILGGLILFHVFAERYSISAIIEGNAVLRRLDSWTGRRG